MKKIIFIIMAMMMCIVAKGQHTRYINHFKDDEKCTYGSFFIEPLAISLNHYSYDVLIKEAKDCIDWYHEKSKEYGVNGPLEYDTLVFDRPFFLYAYNKGKRVAKLMLIRCFNVGVEVKYMLSADNKPFTAKRIKLADGTYSGERKDLACQTFLIIPTNENMIPFYCGIFLLSDFFKPFMKEMLYEGYGVEELLARQSEPKSLR